MMRAAPLRYGAVLGFVAAPHSGLVTRLRVPAPLTCAGVAQLSTYQRRFASTANDTTTQLTKTKPMLATKEPIHSLEIHSQKMLLEDPLPYYADIHTKEEAKRVYKDSKNLIQWVLYHYPAKATDVFKIDPEDRLRLKPREEGMAKKRSREDDETMGTGKPNLVAYSAYSASLVAEPSILKEFDLVTQLRSRPAGLSALANKIEQSVDNVRLALKTHSSMQYTATLVIQNASGVGKTFGSVAVAGILNSKANEDKNADYYLPLYIGLGDVFPITQAEHDLLRDQSQQTYHEDRVRAVICRRLLLQLMFISDKLAKGNLKLWDVVESEEHRGFHLTPAPPKISTFSSQKEFPRICDKAEARCAELIQQLSEHCDGRKLVVLLIIDEGQMLDQYIEPKNDDGARLALLFGRELQLSCSENTKDAFLLLVTTGINSATSLSDTTDDFTLGKNNIYREPLNTVNDLVDIALSLDHDPVEATRQKRAERLAALFYPAARDMVLVYAAKGMPFKKILPQFDLAPSTAQLMVMARGTETEVDMSKWDNRVPAIFSDSHFMPVPSFYNFSNYLPHFEGLRLGILTFGESVLKALEFQNYRGFKWATIDILNAILALTNMPGEPDKSDAAEYQRMREDWLKRNEWFNLTLGTEISLKSMPLYESWDRAT